MKLFLHQATSELQREHVHSQNVIVFSMNLTCTILAGLCMRMNESLSGLNNLCCWMHPNVHMHQLHVNLVAC